MRKPTTYDLTTISFKTCLKQIKNVMKFNMFGLLLKYNLILKTQN